MSSQVSCVRERLVFAFNTFYSDFLSDVTKADEVIKKRLKKHYRVLNRKSDQYLIDFHGSAVSNGTLEHVFDDFGDSAEVGELLVARGLKYKDLPGDQLAHVRMLCAVSWLFAELCDASEAQDNDDSVTAINELFEKFMEGVAAVQLGKSWGGSIDCVLDEDAKRIFRNTLTTLTISGSEAASDDREPDQLTDEDRDAMTNAFEMMKCSKLGGIVQEISQSIDKNQLKEAVQNGGLGGDNMDMMGDLFKQVSGAITSKLQSGEISNDDLIAETMSLMGSVKGMM